MHAGELAIDAAMVGRLLAEQFPQWAGLPLAPVPSAGTDNAIFRLGGELAVRMPRIHWAAGQVEKEQRWLPILAPRLPLAIPVPVALGEPGAGYPWPWSVYRWLEGETASLDRLADPAQAALDLADFINALQQIETAGGPLPGLNNTSRGEPLANRDDETRQAIDTLRGAIDANAATDLWNSALDTPAWRDPPVWLHGDLQPGNLLALGGRLRAVIDFGCLVVGDPATDVMAAWTYLSAGTRDLFRAALRVDDATWARGRGWALSFGAIALPYYWTSNPTLAGIARRTIDEALADYRANG